MTVRTAARQAAWNLALRGRELAYTGRSRECPCCGRTFRAFLGSGVPRRPQARCPHCASLERHRLLRLWYDRMSPPIGGRTLHFAVEEATRELFEAPATLYRTADLMPGADIQADITDLPFEDGAWDLIVCNHVLEHVPDDAKAISEIRRVLSPDGRAVIMVPKLRGAVTEEDPDAPEAERLRRFGQTDHVRLYGDDFEQRLRDGGLTHLEPIAPALFTEVEVYRYGLRAVSVIENVAFLAH